MKKYHYLLLFVFLNIVSVQGQIQETDLLPPYLQLYQEAEKQKELGNDQAAIFNYLEVVDYLRTLSSNSDEFTADIYFTIAQLEFDHFKQLKAIQKGIQALSSNFTITNLYKYPSLDQIKYPKKALGLVNFKIYILYHYWDNTKGSETHLNYALQACHFADDLITKIRGDLGADSVEKEKQLPNFLMAYEQGMEIASSFFTITGDSYYFDQAFYFAERNKSILLAENLTNSQYKTQLGNLLPSDTLLKQEIALKKEITQIEIELSLAKTKKKEQLITNITHQYEKRKVELAAINQKIRTDYPSYYERLYRIDIPKIEDIQATLDKETVVVEYSANDAMSKYIYSGENKSLFIFTISKEDLSITKIPWSQELNKQLVTYHKQLKKINIIRPKYFKKFTELSHLFYKKLITPINKYIPKNKKLIFIVEDQLNYLPFESLIKNPPPSTDEPSFSQLEFLLKYFDVSYHYSASLLFNTLKKERNANHFLGFAPVFSEEDSLSVSFADQFIEDAANLSFDRGTSFAPLKWSELEVKKVNALFQDNGAEVTTSVLRESATKIALQEQLEEAYDFIHIASHSFAVFKETIKTKKRLF